jgi:cholesterol transport system auxiliary component
MKYLKVVQVGWLAMLVVGACVVTAGATGCALTSKAEVVDIRYFSPEQIKPRLSSGDASMAPAAPAPNHALEVRLGRVTSGPNLRERIAFRDDAFELGYYEDRRWTERPETFVRRSLGRTLFEEKGFHRAMGGDAPTIEVEVIAFDELKLASGHAARVQLKVVLTGDRDVLFEETLTVDRPVNGAKPKFEDVIAAMADALDGACEQISDHVGKAVAAARASGETGSRDAPQH